MTMSAMGGSGQFFGDGSDKGREALVSVSDPGGGAAGFAFCTTGGPGIGPCSTAFLADSNSCFVAPFSLTEGWFGIAAFAELRAVGTSLSCGEHIGAITSRSIKSRAPIVSPAIDNNIGWNPLSQYALRKIRCFSVARSPGFLNTREAHRHFNNKPVVRK